jgi:signal transduction histidine kinase
MAIIADIQHVPPPPAGRPRRVPWSPRAWLQALYLAGAIPVLGFVPLIVILPVVPGHGRKKILLLLFLMAFAALVSPVLTRVHRHRLRATAGVEIPPQPPMPGWFMARGFARIRSQSTWRKAVYHFLAAPLLAVAAAAAVCTWLASALYSLVYVYAWALRPDSMIRRGVIGGGASNLPRVGLPVDVWLTAVGVAGFFIAPRLVAGVAWLDAQVASGLLGPSKAEQLAHRVEHLTQTRAGVVDAADAERRRIERDLHDGTQQRLVSLAMNLGMARAQARTAEEVFRALGDAHEEAKAALAELRDLIRGLHPAVLEDRGLDAALSGVAARMPIPVRLSVDLPKRPAPVIEAVAYFVVSEGLANIAKHAQATQAEVVVQRAGDRLHVIITDDGVGGADAARGTGLAGLAKRAQSVDGTFEISSPVGGPTLLTVDLPCTR